MTRGKACVYFQTSTPSSKKYICKYQTDSYVYRREDINNEL